MTGIIIFQSDRWFRVTGIIIFQSDRGFRVTGTEIDVSKKVEVLTYSSDGGQSDGQAVMVIDYSRVRP